VEIEGQGTFPNFPADFKPVEFFAGRVKLPNGYNAATEFEIDLTFSNGNHIIVRPKPRNGTGNGVLIEGENGRINVSRGNLTGKPIEDLTAKDQEWLDDEVKKLYRGKSLNGHMDNFFECVKDRSLPISDVFTHHRSVSSCHLCNLAMLLKRKRLGDPQKEDFIGDAEATALLSRPQRQPYTVPT